MKTVQILAAVIVVISGAVYAAEGHNHAHDHKSLYGGIVTGVKGIDYELVAKADSLQLFVRDHGKSVDLAKAGAKLTLLVGTEKVDVELKPAGDRLETQGSFKAASGAKVVVVISRPGVSAATVRFVLK